MSEKGENKPIRALASDEVETTTVISMKEVLGLLDEGWEVAEENERTFLMQRKKPV